MGWLLLPGEPAQKPFNALHRLISSRDFLYQPLPGLHSPVLKHSSDSYRL